MTDQPNQETILDTMTNELQGGRFIALRGIPGPQPSYCIILENAQEQRATIVFTSSCQTTSEPSNVAVKPHMNITVEKFK